LLFIVMALLCVDIQCSGYLTLLSTSGDSKRLGEFVGEARGGCRGQPAGVRSTVGSALGAAAGPTNDADEKGR
jgi:hypothetical protein